MKPPRPSKAARLEAIRIRLDAAGGDLAVARRSFQKALRLASHASTLDRRGEDLPEFDAAIERAEDARASAWAELYFARDAMWKLRPTYRDGI